MPRLTLEDIAVEVASQRILDRVSLALEPGAAMAVTGPSGAGKTTMLHVMAGIVQPAHGRIKWGEDAISGFSESRCDRWRREHVGYVFQNFHLVGELSALDNVLLPLTFDSFSVPAPARNEAQALLSAMGVTSRAGRAGMLSRGEQQRVAIARALIRRPQLLLADEPTASLDATNAKAVTDLLLQAANDSGATLVVVSHDQSLLARIPRQLHVAAGKPAQETINGTTS
jgi:putative ABC transport system ATP-binding protein